MTQKNPYLITKLPETASVSYYDVETDQNSTVKEWNQLHPDIVPDEVIIIDNAGNYHSWKVGVDCPPYGPGFWDDFGNVTWEVTKFTGRVVAVGTAGAAIVATGGVAAPLIGGGVYLGGKTVKKIAQSCDNEFFEDLGDFVEDVGLDGLTGGLTKAAGGLAAREIARHGYRMTNGAKLLIESGKVIKIGNKAYSKYNSTVEKIELLARTYHGKHKSRTNYDSDCPICRGDFD